MHTEKSLLRRIHYARDQRLAGAAVDRLDYEYQVWNWLEWNLLDPL